MQSNPKKNLICLSSRGLFALVDQKEIMAKNRISK